MDESRTLLVKVSHVLYPLTDEVLHQIFSPYGLVEMVIIFQETDEFQAMLQYQLRQSAITAQASLHGHHIYDGCCLLDFQFANLDKLLGPSNTDPSTDFTSRNSPLTEREKSSELDDIFDLKALVAASTEESAMEDIAMVENGEQIELLDNTHQEFPQMVPIGAVTAKLPNASMPEGCEDPVDRVGRLPQATVALPLDVFIGFCPGGFVSLSENIVNCCAIQLFDKIPKPVVVFNSPSVQSFFM